MTRREFFTGSVVAVVIILAPGIAGWIGFLLTGDPS